MNNQKFPRPLVIFSRCLGFDSCRYSGTVIAVDWLEPLKDFCRVVTVCPETNIGLGVPRDAVRQVLASDGSQRLFQPKTGRDCTQEVSDLFHNFLKHQGTDVDGFILKNRSPTCGIGDAKVYYSGAPGAYVDHKGPGFYGNLVKTHFNHSRIEDEGRLRNQRIREHFFTAIFLFASFREIRKSPELRSLVDFQARNKLLLLGQSEKHLRLMGKLVANNDKLPVEEIFQRYFDLLVQAFERLPRYQAQQNVMQHIFGYFSQHLRAEEKDHFASLLDTYRLGRLPLAVMQQVLKTWVLRFEVKYLANQSWFEPFPTPLYSPLHF